MKFEVLSANAMGKHHTCKMFICFDLLPSFMMQEVIVEHHHLLRPGSEPMPLKPFSIDPVKGWTRASCVAFIALAVSELPQERWRCHLKNKKVGGGLGGRESGGGAVAKSFLQL